VSSFETMCRLDELLAAGGHHRMHPKWAETWQAFYARPFRQLVARVGRGGAKSFNACKFALNETLFGDFQVPPGERHIFVFVSVRETEALERLRLIESFLRTLNEPFERRGETIELTRLPRSIRVLAANIGATSGPRAIGGAADEVAKMRNNDGVHNAKDVIANIRAMSVLQPKARFALISSAFGMVDHHFELCGLGTTAQQLFVEGPTWQWNNVTEADTRSLEPDDRIWRREYLAVPSSSAESVFDYADIEACFAPFDASKYHHHQSFMVLDPSSLRGDAFVVLICHWAQPIGIVDALRTPFGVPGVGRVEERRINVTGVVHGPYGHAKSTWFEDRQILIRPDGTEVAYVPAPPPPPVLRVDAIFAYEPGKGIAVTMTDLVRELVVYCRGAGIRNVFADDRESASLQALFNESWLAYRPYKLSGPSKQAAVETAHRLMREHTLSIAEDTVMRRQLHEYSAKLTATGHIQFAGRGPHDDRAAAIITLMHTLNDSELMASPYSPTPILPGFTPPNYRTELTT
jgi:hypothetical protein